MYIIQQNDGLMVNKCFKNFNRAASCVQKNLGITPTEPDKLYHVERDDLWCGIFIKIITLDIVE